jgi:acyl carrier protein
MIVALSDAGDVDATLRAVLVDVLGLPQERVSGFTEASPLFGALPEFDSMAVAGLLTELEERLGIFIEDHEIDADMLETYGALADLRPGEGAEVSFAGGLAYDRYRTGGREEWLMRIGPGRRVADPVPAAFVRGDEPDPRVPRRDHACSCG